MRSRSRPTRPMPAASLAPPSRSSSSPTWWRRANPSPPRPEPSCAAAGLRQSHLLPPPLFSRGEPAPDLIRGRRAAARPAQRLGTERRKSVAQRKAGNLHQPRKRLTQLEDQKNRAGSRHRKDEQGADNDSVGFGEQTEARKDHGEPEDQDHEERHGN